MKKITALLFSALLMLPPPVVGSASEMSLFDGQVGFEDMNKSIPVFKDNMIYVWQEDGGILTKEGLLDYVDYESNKNDLEVTIESHVVYIIRGENTYYYHDLNRVLEKSSLDNIVSFNEEHAIRQGFKAAEGSTPFIDQINLSHSSTYTLSIANDHGSSEAYLTVENRWDPVPPTTPPEGNPIPEFKMRDIYVGRRSGKVLTTNDLLSYIEYDGNNDDLEISIESTSVYLIRGDETYFYHDLNHALQGAHINNVSPTYEDWAIRQGYVAAEGSSPFISQINLSANTSYNLIVSNEYGTSEARLHVEFQRSPDGWDIELPVTENQALTKTDLLKNVSYNGDMADLKLFVQPNNVYVNADKNSYFHDLNKALGKWDIDNIEVLKADSLLLFGNPYIRNDSDSIFMDTINKSLPGTYNVIVTDSLDQVVSEGYVAIYTSWVSPPEPEPEPPIVVEPEKLPTLKFIHQRNNFSLKHNSTISMKELQELVQFDNNIEDLEFSIFSDMVYVPKGSENYHFDLDELLKTSKINDITVYTEKDAISKGLTPSDESGSAVSSINRSLPGKYTVEVSYDFGEEDGRRISVSGEILVTGQTEKDPDPDDSTKPDDVSNDDSKSGDGSNNGSNNGLNNGSNTRNTNRQTRSSLKQSKLPATGSKQSATISIIGLGIFAAGAYILSKRKQFNK